MSTATISGATIPATISSSASLSLPTAAAAATATTTSSSSSTSNPSSNVAIGCIVVACLAVLFLLGAYARAFYIRFRGRPPSLVPTPDPILPRVVFITAADDDDHHGGLDPAAIGSYPKFPFSNARFADDSVCSICLCEYREGETLRMIPDCRHRFHLTCIDAWLRLNASCPVCRTSPMPTPLSELVPLSLHYSADRWRTR